MATNREIRKMRPHHLMAEIYWNGVDDTGVRVTLKRGSEPGQPMPLEELFRYSHPDAPAGLREAINGLHWALKNADALLKSDMSDS